MIKGHYALALISLLTFRIERGRPTPAVKKGEKTSRRGAEEKKVRGTEGEGGCGEHQILKRRSMKKQEGCPRRGTRGRESPKEEKTL